MNNSNTIY
ncbi:hypothetical protein CFP56_006882 [Quercus suber]|uniref:Uncharacterized protein n=1 Tax=Quercus suber TaxID=58331 RepID=A0AAW0M7S5_QUESU